MIRVYANWFDDPDGYFWMFDTGPGTSTTKLKRVVFSGATGELIVDESIMLQDARDLDRPKSWIRFRKMPRFVVHEDQLFIE